jgi:hypothetical protein
MGGDFIAAFFISGNNAGERPACVPVMSGSPQKKLLHFAKRKVWRKDLLNYLFKSPLCKHTTGSGKESSSRPKAGGRRSAGYFINSI